MAPTTAPTPTPTATAASPIIITVQNNFNALVFPGPLGSGCPASDYSVAFIAGENVPTVTFTAVSSSPSQISILNSLPGSNATTYFVGVPTNNTNFTATSIVVTDSFGNSVTVPVTFNLACL
jgi:hypothetical protein